MPAVGFALGVDRLHIALAGEERGTGTLLAQRRRGGSPHERHGLTIAVPRGALFKGTVDLLEALGMDTGSCARTTASCCSRRSA